MGAPRAGGPWAVWRGGAGRLRRAEEFRASRGAGQSPSVRMSVAGPAVTPTMAPRKRRRPDRGGGLDPSAAQCDRRPCPAMGHGSMASLTAALLVGVGGFFGAIARWAI